MSSILPSSSTIAAVPPPEPTSLATSPGQLVPLAGRPFSAAAVAALAAALIVAMATSSCTRTAEPGESAQAAPDAPGAAASAQVSTLPGPWAPADGVRFSLAPAAGDVKTVVAGELAQARADGRRVLVYVGATWCEPCQRFHHAAMQGALDAELGKLTFVQFDLDQDRDRLRAAGYTSDFIPLFALPAADGSASVHHVEGSIKGDGAVAELVPRLKALLAGQ